ncbi:MAG: chromate efflux transporter [Hyphomicrobium aestuarii]|nr:chromate efflux transporter [Hyphomicrobium aestuarii]
MPRDDITPPTAPPQLIELIRVFGQIGFISFGGPAGQIALMHRMLVDERRWIGEQRFLSALNFCMLLPGPEAMQLATYVGWTQRGVVGGLIAGLLFVLPGAALMLALSLGYALYGNVPVVSAVFLGIKAAVVAIVIEALLKVARRALKGTADWIVAAAAFIAIYAFDVPFPLIVLAAAMFGFIRASGIPSEPAASKDDGRAQTASAPGTPGSMPGSTFGGSLSSTATTVILWLAIWIAPLAAVVAIFGPDHVLSQMAWLFSKLAVVTFGGAYAVLAYMAQAVVDDYRWLKPGEMMDGLGLAETTPGPLILVLQFVGTIAAFREGGGSPILMGVLGAFVTVWATFAPCFLWVFAGAPYVERLTRMPKLSSALKSVTAAVVGVILNLTVWFALHVLFKSVGTYTAGPVKITIPDVTSADPLAFSLAAVAAVMLFVWHRGIMVTLAVCAALALLAAQIVKQTTG